jgi:hypothetical protein
VRANTPTKNPCFDSYAAIAMSAASSATADAAPKRPFDPSLADPSPPSKLQRSSQPDISPAEKLESAADGDGASGAESEAMCGARISRAQRYLVAVEYAGTRFSGSQQQPDKRTVVGVLEEAFHKFIGQPVSVFCSSRTDSGVHALSNVCHVDVERISKRKPGEVVCMHILFSPTGVPSWVLSITSLALRLCINYSLNALAASLRIHLSHCMLD